MRHDYKDYYAMLPNWSEQEFYDDMAELSLEDIHAIYTKEAWHSTEFIAYGSNVFAENYLAYLRALIRRGRELAQAREYPDKAQSAPALSRAS